MVKDAEADGKANIDSDHYPVKIKCRFALKAFSQAQPPTPKPKYHVCSEEERRVLNEHVRRNMRETEIETGQQKLTIFSGTLKEATAKLPTKEAKLKDSHYTRETENILKRRRDAVLSGNIEQFEQLTKDFRKSKKQDKKQYVLRSIREDMDPRDKWMGIKQLKSEYRPQPYHRRDRAGRTIEANKTAEAFAVHLAETWKHTPTPTHEISENKLPIPDLPYMLGDITIDEIQAQIKRLKKNKATGPDEIPMEVIKELDDENISMLCDILNIWWREEEIEEQYLQATVCLIYKKGSTALLDNYRPISLLNSLYKLFTAIVQKRLAAQLDPFLQKTQFGFRKDRSTADAIHCIRRAAEHGEQTQKQAHFVLLDWAKAFDKVDRQALLIAMAKMNIPTKYINIVRAIYTNTKFNITMEGHTSSWQRQETGIRQGCPLSPYLFLIVMTTLFHDIHLHDKQHLTPHRICGANFDEIVYADDTICISTNTRSMNMFLKDIENEGRKYGLLLNRTKCELLTTSRDADIKFEDGTRVKRKSEVTYLGCQINQYSNITQEISKRIGNCMAVLKKLDLFWRHCDVRVGFKITVMDAVIRAKLLYGMDSAQLTPANQRRLEVLQLKGLRKILKMTTTFVERNNSNEEVFRRANDAIRQETPAGKIPKRIQPFVKCFRNSRMKRLARLYNMPNEHPVRHITFAPHPKNNIAPWIPGNRRVGRPRFKWVTETLNDMWTNIAHSHTHITQAFDKNEDDQQHEAIRHCLDEQASNPPFLFK